MLNYFRDYDPAIGRYIQTDPIGLYGGINSFIFPVNPLLLIDPLGLFVLPAIPNASDDNFGGFLFNRLLDGGIIDNVRDYGVGFTDSATMGVTKALRKSTGHNWGVDESSTSYTIGDWFGEVPGVLNPAKKVKYGHDAYKRASLWRQTSNASRKTRQKRMNNAVKEIKQGIYNGLKDLGVTKAFDKTLNAYVDNLMELPLEDEDQLRWCRM